MGKETINIAEFAMMAKFARMDRRVMPVNGRLIQCITLLIYVSAWPLACAAQSFDCAKAAGPHEKLICSNPDLAAADKQLAAVYRSTMAQLSEEGKRRLAESQRSWLTYDRDAGQPDAETMKASYRGRLEQLRRSLKTEGPFRMQYVALYYAPPPPKTDSSGQDSAVNGGTDMTFPRIDAPATEEATRLNQLVEQEMAAAAGTAGIKVDGKSLAAGKLAVTNSDPEQDVSIRADIVYAAPDLVSIRLGTLSYYKGAAHPNGTLAGFTVLIKGGRILAPSDLFGEAQSWKTAVSQMTFSKLKAAATRNGWNLHASDNENLATDPHKWTITKSGLVITFSPYEISDYASGSHEVTLTWLELKPYLKNPLPFQIPAP